MMSDRSNSFFRYLSYVIELLLMFVLGTTPGLMPELFGAKPALLVCAALTVAVFEREIPAMIFGMLAGVLTDLGYSNSIGVFTISLTVICFIVGYAANNLIVAKFLNYLLYAAVAVGILFMLYFLVRFAIPGTEDRWQYFTAHIVSRMAQTFLYSIPFYFINRFIYSSLSPEE
ncbi:MAG: rod shape-determining protein MreD [Ruminococcus sp.]|nr:rod shape-determining protein MreD [Ruminococcus sp.]